MKIIYHIFYILTHLLSYVLACLLSYILACLLSYVLACLLSYVLARRISSQACCGHPPQTIYPDEHVSKCKNMHQNTENTQKNMQNRNECACKHTHKSFYKSQLMRATTENTEYENHLTHHYLTHS